MPEQDEVFTDGNMSVVVRRGNEVRRGRGTWWQGSAAVLTHLEDVGFPYSPRLLGYDGEIERLSFMPGDTLAADLAGGDSDLFVVQVGHMIRAYHDAMRSFVVSQGVAWPAMIGAPASDGTICHNDIAPWNTVFHDGEFVGLIDWDLVSPGTRAWDLAYAAWRFVPLYQDEAFGSVSLRVRRITDLLDAYGLSSAERRGFTSLIRDRMRTSYETVEVWGAQGVPGFDRLYEQGLHRDELDCITWVERELVGLEV